MTRKDLEDKFNHLKSEQTRIMPSPKRQEIPFAQQQESSLAAAAAMNQGRGPSGNGFQ